MENIASLISINNICFTIFGYEMSYIELIGTSLGLVSVWLAIKANIHTWTTGIINILAFFCIYYQIQLYSDMFLQIFFFGSSIIGIWQWLKKKTTNSDKKITRIPLSVLFYIIIANIALTFALGLFMSKIHIYFPAFFSTPASYPYADSLTTILSISATFLMAYKKLECWMFWITVDIICVYLYFQKDVLFISLEFFIFLFMAIGGFIHWFKAIKNAKRISIG